MKYTFLRQTEGNSRLIIIMTGWSTGPTLLRELDIEGWDILVCYSYNNFNFPRELLEPYKTIYLFAWSLGVAAAEMTFGDIDITAAYAVNGTPRPVHNRHGIPTDIFTGTAVGLNVRNLLKFQRRMCVNITEYMNFSPLLKQDDSIESLRAQLLLFARTTFPEPRLPWRRVYISDKDSIFPPKNMTAYWEKFAKNRNVEIIHTDSGHFVELDKLVRTHIADLSKVARSFSSSHTKYGANAIAQKRIAEQLAEMVPDFGFAADALEIGPGTGIFTRLYRRRLDIYNLHLVDLYNVSPMGFKPDETFVLADAEQWIEKTENKWDIVLSSSAIQWFANLRRFFENVRSHLKPGGHLVCSTFLPGNLAQLDTLRPSPLLYLGREEIENMLYEIFDGFHTDSEDIVLPFETPRKALLHLRDTGVAGVGASGKTVSRILKALTPNEGRKVELTYRPLYIHAWINPKY